MLRRALTNFSKGEFGPELYGRVDIPQYSAGAKQLSNWIIQRYGGIFFRPGFQFVAPVPENVRRLIPFQYSIDQAYVLIPDQYAMLVAASGGLILEDNLKILSVETGSETTLEIPFHDMEVGDQVYLAGVEGMTELNNRFATITAVPDADHITIDVDSTTFSVFVSSDGEERTAPPAPPPAPEPPPAEVIDVSDAPDVVSPGVDLGSSEGPGPGSYYVARFEEL